MLATFIDLNQMVSRLLGKHWNGDSADAEQAG
jgi:hypothetical protein